VNFAVQVVIVNLTVNVMIVIVYVQKYAKDKPWPNLILVTSVLMNNHYLFKYLCGNYYVVHKCTTILIILTRNKVHTSLITQ
jgi:hypothetical protein